MTTRTPLAVLFGAAIGLALDPCYLCVIAVYVCVLVCRCTHIVNETAAEPDPGQTQQHTWKCAHNETFSIIFVGVP